MALISIPRFDRIARCHSFCEDEMFVIIALQNIVRGITHALFN